MNAEFFDAIIQIEKEKGIPREYMYEKISQAVATAIRHDPSVAGDNVCLEMDENAKTMRMVIVKTIVEEPEDRSMEVSLEEARAVDPTLNLGDVLRTPVETKEFGRIAAQTAKQVIIQGIREAERGIIFQQYTSKEHEILTAIVLRVDPRNGNAFLHIVGSEDTGEIMLPFAEQVKGETLKDGSHIKVYVVEVRKSFKGPQIFISRSNPGLVKRLFELEVPEIRDGVVEIMGITREAGSRTKMSVRSHDSNVEAVGACIGNRRSRITSIINELDGEKIDIIPYSDNDTEYVKAALQPAQVISVEMIDDNPKACRVIVPDDQLSLAIGRDGQNARLAARLTEVKIDIKSESSIL